MVAKAMTYRDVRKAFLAQGCTSRPGKGDHEVWTCPEGTHKTTVTRPGIVSPGVVRQAIQNMVCLPKGWLQ